MRRSCKGCGSSCGVPGCRVCRGKALCSRCQRRISQGMTKKGANTAMVRINQTIRDAVSDALGYEVDDTRIKEAVNEYGGEVTEELRKTLRAKESAFEEHGGRGVDLADEIDNLRIAIAVRTAK